MSVPVGRVEQWKKMQGYVTEIVAVYGIEQGDSDEDGEAEEQVRMTFLGDVKKAGKASQRGVFAAMTEDAQVRCLRPFLS